VIQGTWKEAMKAEQQRIPHLGNSSELNEHKDKNSVMHCREL
jgi:hypothetical protein